MTSKKLGHPLPISAADLSYIRPLISCCEAFDSPGLLTKAGQLLRLLVEKTECTIKIVELEKALVQESIPELSLYLKDKLKLLGDTIGGMADFGYIVPLEDSQGVAREMLKDVSKLNKLKETFRCMDYNLKIESIREEVLVFYEQLKDLPEFQELVKSLGETLIAVNKVENVALYSIIDTYAHTFIYALGLLKESMAYSYQKGQQQPQGTDKLSENDRKLYQQYENVIIETREVVNQVFKSSIPNIVKDLRLIEKIRGSPLLNILDSTFKKALLSYYLQQAQKGNKRIYIPINARRSHIVGDTVRAFDLHRTLLSRPSSFLQVTFTGERILASTKKEWLALMLKEIFNPEKGLFVLSQNKRCFMPSSQSFLVANSLHLFRIAGNLIGLSIKEGVHTGVSLTKAFLKHLIGQEPEVSDLEEIDFDLAQRLLNLRDKAIEGPELHFSYEVPLLGTNRVVELVESGSQKVVTEENKEEYINLYVKSKLSTEIEAQASAFTKGLGEIIPDFLVKTFSPSQLENLINGPFEVDLEELHKHVEYVNCSVAESAVYWLWEILEEYSNEDRRRFLYFATGCSSFPVRNIGEFKLRILKVNSRGLDDLPKGHKWCNELELPEYHSKDTLRENLGKALDQ